MLLRDRAGLRPHHGKPYRRAWELLHKGSGYIAVVLAAPTICLGAVVAGGTITPTYLSIYGVVLLGLAAYAVVLWKAAKEAKGGGKPVTGVEFGEGAGGPSDLDVEIK